MQDKIVNYFALEKVVAKNFPEVNYLSFDFTAKGKPYLSLDMDSEDDLRWTSKMTQAALSCGEVLFNDYIEVAYWLNNCAERLIPGKECQCWTQNLEEQTITVDFTDGSVTLSIEEIANLIKKSEKAFYPISALETFHLELVAQ